MSNKTEIELMHIQRHVQDAVAVATSRGYQLPQAYTDATAISVAAKRVRDAVLPAPPAMPSKAKDVESWIATVVADKAWHSERTAAAGDVVAYADRTAGLAIVEAVPNFLRQVCDDFDAIAENFRRVLASAPRGVTGQMSAEEFELHAELLRAVEALTIGANHRARLALLIDEAREIGPDGLWLVMEPTEDATLEQVRDLLHKFAGRLPTTVEEWEAISRVGLRVARSGDVTARREKLAELTYASSNARDGGRLDKTYGEAASLTGHPFGPLDRWGMDQW